MILSIFAYYFEEKMTKKCKNEERREKKKNRNDNSNKKVRTCALYARYHWLGLSCHTNNNCRVLTRYTQTHSRVMHTNKLNCVFHLCIDMFFIWHWKAAKYILLNDLAFMNDIARTKLSVISGKRTDSFSTNLFPGEFLIK